MLIHMKIRIDTNTILLLFVIGLFLYVNRNHNLSREKPDTVIIQDNRDDLDREIIREPKRFYDSKYHSRRQMAVNVPTRGEAPSYQQVGYLGGVSDPENIKPLYGRQTYPGSNQWNYFTSLDSHLATKIPLDLDGKDCTDARGCKELYKNDKVNVNGTEYTANIYQTHAPRYIPY